MRRLESTDDLRSDLRVGDVAKLLGVTEWKVYELVRTRQLRCIRIGRSIRFNRQIIADLINQGGTRELREVMPTQR